MPSLAAATTPIDDDDADDNDKPSSKRRIDKEEDAMMWQHRVTWDESTATRYRELHAAMRACKDYDIKPLLDEALDCLRDAIRLYSADAMLCSFNGGKDATVILHLFCAALAAAAASDEADDITTTPPMYRPRGVYFDSPNEFPEVLCFTQDTVRDVDMDMLAFCHGTSFVDGLTRLTVAHNGGDGGGRRCCRPLAFVLGTRESDPNAHGQGLFSPSSPYMPPFMRINPILHWNYGHVWHFLRLFSLPYCHLYDAGYTSIGSVHDTVPCPALRIRQQADNDNDDSTLYLPAHMLQDWDQERAGRIGNSASTTSSTKKKQQQPTPPAASVQTSVSQTAPETEQEEETSAGVAGSLEETTLSQLPHDDDDDGGVNAVVVAETNDDDDNTTVANDNGSQMMPTTVAILIVGDEILKGFAADTNTVVAARALKRHNVLLKQVVVVSDTVHEIAQELRRLRCIVDVVITSGGVGPTKDDVTISGVAAALDVTIEHHEEMAALMRKKMNVTAAPQQSLSSNSSMTESLNKMAQLPQHAKLRYLSGPDAWPVLQCQNVFVLPGIPEFFSPKVEKVAEYLAYHARGLSYQVVLTVDETCIVDVLNYVMNSHPSVAIGCYPFVSRPEFKTVVTVEGQPDDDAAVRRALADLVDRVPAGSVVRVDANLTLLGG
jgi:molybdenum cofactor synthesis domain-containing protein